jgi:hypothetical protein
MDDLPIMEGGIVADVNEKKKLKNTIFVKNQYDNTYIYCGIVQKYFDRSEATPFIFRENEYF